MKSGLNAYNLYLLPIILIITLSFSLYKTATATSLTSTKQSAPQNNIATSEDLLIYWPADEGTGSTLFDASGNGYDLTLTGSQTYTTNTPSVSFDNGYAIDYTNGGTNVSTGNDIGDMQQFTIALWIYPDTTISGNDRLLSISGKAVLRSQNGNLNLYVVSNDTNYHATTTNLLSPGSYYHVAGTYDGSNLRVYINGVELGSTSFSGALDTATSVALNSSIETFDGVMDDVRIYNRALSANEINDLANGEDGFACATEYTGDNATDFVSSDNSALQLAANAVSNGGTVKVAGTCAGIWNTGAVGQTIDIENNMTIEGGYLAGDWSAKPDSINYPTTLDAEGTARVMEIDSGYEATLSHLTLTGGITSYGGGIWLQGTVVIENSTIINNDATVWGGGIYVTHNNANSLTIINSSIISNTAADDGGGLWAGDELGMTVSITNTTISNNQSGDLGGGVYGGNDLDLNFYHVTLADNIATTAGNGIAVGSIFPKLTNTLLSNNGNDCYTPSSALDLTGGYNFIASSLSGNCVGLYDSPATSFTNQEAYLLALADNGGGMLTNTPYGYGVLDRIPAGTNGCGSTYDTDQIGTERPYGNGCDIGATEATPSCYTEITNDNNADFATTDSSALDYAYNAWNGSRTFKIAGTCTGVKNTNMMTLDSDITVRGGYTLTNWSTSNPDTHITTLDASADGRVILVSSGVTATIDGLIITGGSGNDGAGINNDGILYLTNSTVTDNHAGNNNGGGIRNLGELYVSNTIISYNKNTNRDGGGLRNQGTAVIEHSQLNNNNVGLSEGAGIYNSNVLTISYTTIKNHQSGEGAAIFNTSTGVIDILYSIINNNDNDQLQNGGALSNDGGTIYIAHSTFMNNDILNNFNGDNSGGAIANESGGQVTIENSTFSNNTATNSGGALYNSNDSTMNLIHATITANQADNDNDGGNGGGFYSTGQLYVTNSIIIDNNDRSGSTYDDCRSTGTQISYGYNILGTNSGCDSLAGALDFRSNSAGLDNLNANGGPIIGINDAMQTHALQSTSIALNQIPNGVNGCGDTYTIDQRGYNRVSNASLDCDIGAYETDIVGGGQNCLLEMTGDNVTDYGSITALALTKGLETATIGTEIRLSGSCIGVSETNGFTQTAYIDTGLTIIGGYTYTDWSLSSDPDTYPTILDAKGQGRVIYIDNAGRVTLENINLVDGFDSSKGAGIINNGTQLTLTNTIIYSHTVNLNGGGLWTDSNTIINNSHFYDNVAGRFGGAIYFSNSTHWVTNSTFLSNTSTITSTNRGGGAIFTRANLLIEDSTFGFNHAADNGGALFSTQDTTNIYRSTFISNTATTGGALSHGHDNSGTVYVEQSTFSGNQATNQGGGFYANNGSNIIVYSTFADNSATTGGAIYYSAPTSLQLMGNIIADSLNGTDCETSSSVTDNGYNLIEQADSNCNIVNGLNNSLTGLDPALNSLADNGGPTWTYALTSNSPAIDRIPAGSCTTTTDQIGTSRPQGLYCDIGSYETDTMATAITPTVTITTTNSPNALINWTTELNCIHFLYNSTSPYTGFALLDTILHTTDYEDTAGTLGNTTTNTFYYLTSYACGSNSYATSTTNGEFDYEIVAGN
ncbi:MAG TPA: LamG domain-containing protein [Anaerolineae bacterium]|nr:LamG domain-containing protein [Anaerolineae bacterium]